MNRHIISRPARALLPAALAAYSLCVPSSAQQSLGFMAAVLLARLMSLASGSAFRIAAGSVVNEARLRGNFAASLVCAVIGGILSAAVCTLPLPYLSAIGTHLAIAGALINIAQLCSDRLYAAFDSFSPSLFDIIIAALSVAGLMMSEGAVWLIPACALPVVIAGFILIIGLRSGSGMKPGFAVIKNAPIAIFNNVLFQCIAVGFSMYLEDSSVGVAITLAAAALIEMCESPFRRNLAESSEITLFMAVCAIAAGISAMCVPILGAEHVYSLHFACAAVLLTGAHIDLRRMLMLVCIAMSGASLAFLSGYPNLIVNITACALLAALCVPEVLSLRRISRARHIQRRRAR